MSRNQEIRLGAGSRSMADAPRTTGGGPGPVMSMADLVLALKAASDDTRLTLLALCRGSEITGSELVSLLGQSQPRVSRHLKLLCDAGLLERTRKGAWVYYRLALDGAHAALASTLDRLIQPDDPALATELARLDQVRQQRAAKAQEYFSRHAPRWDVVRRLDVSERGVETALHAILGTDDIDDLRLPSAAGSVDVVQAHQVRHLRDEPRRLITGAAAMLRPGGRLVIIDFLSHDQDELRREHAHRRLGFDDVELHAWFTESGLTPEHTLHLPGRSLTVGLWSATRAPLDNEA